MIQVFESKRLVCRHWVPQDIDMIFTVYSDKVGSRWVDDGTPITYEEYKRWLEVTEQNYQTRGYASEAVPNLLVYGARHHRLSHIIATVANENRASQRVLSKSGMK